MGFWYTLKKGDRILNGDSEFIPGYSRFKSITYFPKTKTVGFLAKRKIPKRMKLIYNGKGFWVRWVGGPDSSSNAVQSSVLSSPENRVHVMRLCSESYYRGVEGPNWGLMLINSGFKVMVIDHSQGEIARHLRSVLPIYEAMEENRQ